MTSNIAIVSISVSSGVDMRLRRIVLLLLWLVACALCQAQVVTTIDRTRDPVPEEVVPHNTNNDNQPHQTTQPAKSAEPAKSTQPAKPAKTKTETKQTEKVYSLSVSTSSLSFSAAGGTQTITVSSSQPWQIDVDTYSWGHLTRNGSQLTVKIDPNNNTSSRTDYFTITSGNKTQRVDISQAAKEIDYSLSVSTSSLSFSAAGGTQTITVSSSQPWQIGVNTYSWGHLTRNGSQLTIKIDANSNTSSRTDYFTITSGNKTQRIYISQSGRTATTYTSSSSTIRPTNPYHLSYDTGSVVQFGIEVTDFAWNIFSTGNGNVIHYDVGLSVKFGHHRSPVQFELGIKPGILWDMEDYYDDDDEYGTVKFHMPIYARLKVNLCNVGDNGKLYISGMAYYNAIRDKRYESRFSAGGGMGFAWRHWDWQTLYYKQDVSHDTWRRDRFLGTTLIYYF